MTSSSHLAVEATGLVKTFGATRAVDGVDLSVFITPATLPGPLRAFVEINPVTHLVSAARELMVGALPGREIGWILVACAALTAVFAPLSVRLLRTR